MPETLPTTAAQAAVAFSSHDFVAAYDFLAEDVSWDVVGGAVVSGREAVIEACMRLSGHLAGVTTRFTKFRVLEVPGAVVIDSTAEYTGGDGQSVVAACDIYGIAGEKLVEITSYNIELAKGE